MTDQTMAGRTCLITGATNGIGKETALALAGMGATVVITARDERKGRAAQSEIKQRSGVEVDVLFADLGSLAEVRRLAGDYKRRHDTLHVLLNNAGGYHAQRTETADGFEMTFGVNHLAHFLLTGLLLDVIKASAPARIINVSSGAHSGATIDFDDLQSENGYVGMRVYGQSKLANVLFTKELAKRLAGTGVTANSLHPGVVRTGFGQNNTGAIGAIFGLYHAVSRPFILSAKRGAETSIYLASSPDVEDVSGEYFVKTAITQSSPASQDPDAARRLWELSEQLVSGAAG